MANATNAQIHAGPGNSVGSSMTPRHNLLFTCYRGTGGTGGTMTLETGGGDCRLRPNIPARGISLVAVLVCHLVGLFRDTGAQAAGAYR